MQRTHVRRRYVLLATAIVIVAALAAMPATALAAKASTRIVALKSKTVDRSTPGYNPWDTATTTVKLQKKVGGKWRSYSGYVKAYIYDPMAGGYVYLGRLKGSSISMPLVARGKHKFYFAGTSTTKSSVAYTRVYEDIGLAISGPSVNFSLTGPEYTVTSTYVVSWNTEATDPTVGDPAGIVAYRRCEFEDAAYSLWGAWGYGEREIFAPNSVEFTYKVHQTEIDGLTRYLTWAGAYGDSFYRGDYIVEPIEALGDTLVP